MVLLLISTVFGGLNGTGLRYLRRLAKQAAAAGAQDTTKYDTARRSQLSFFEHHARRLSAAAVLGDAKAIVLAITSAKVRATRLTAACDAPQHAQ